MSFKGVILQLLRRRELYDIHHSSLDISERVYLVIREPEALEFLDSDGAQIDYNIQRAWFLRSPVEEMVEKVLPNSGIKGKNNLA